MSETWQESPCGVVEEHEDHAVVLLRRRMRAQEPSILYELRLRDHDGVWRVSGKTISDRNSGSDDGEHLFVYAGLEKAGR